MLLFKAEGCPLVRVWPPFGSLLAAVGSILASFGLLFGAFLIQFVLLGRDSINLVLNFPNFPNNVPFSTFPRSWEPQPRGERREALTREDTTQDLRYFFAAVACTVFCRTRTLLILFRAAYRQLYV